MNADRSLDMVGRPGGPLADSALWTLEVIASAAVSPNVHRLVLTAPGLGGLQYRPGQDLMLRIPGDRAAVTNRRYTIRKLDRARPAVTIDASLHGTGPGTDWMRTVRLGDTIDAIGPRGKITLHEGADWHLFVGDETGMPGALAMIEALAGDTTAIALLEVDSAADEQRPENEQLRGLDIQWLHRLGRSVPGEPELLVSAATGCALPSGSGHAYIAAEKGVVRAVEAALAQRGLTSERISTKAYWRRDAPNAEHGEPGRED